MGSGIGAAEEAVQHLTARSEKVGLIKVRLFRPFDPSWLLAAVPVTVKKIAVLDRCKEPGSDGEPLYKDVLTGLAQAVAIECAARLDQGIAVCARQALEAVQVPVGGGTTRLPLARLVPAGQLRDLEEILEPFCR